MLFNQFWLDFVVLLRISLTQYLFICIDSIMKLLSKQYYFYIVSLLGRYCAVPFNSFTKYSILKKKNNNHQDPTLLLNLKVALDGGTWPGDTLQILPLALAQPPNPRSITSHSVLRGHPSLTHRVGFFRGIQWGIHSQKIIIGTAICFFKKICISEIQMKNIKYTH